MKTFKETHHQVIGIDLRDADQNFDLLHLEEAETALDYAQSEAVVQLAALAGATGRGGGEESLKDPYRFIAKNVRIVNNVYEACRKLKIRKAIVMSSFSPYGKAPCPITEETPLNPNNPYGASKVMTEEIAKIYATCFGIKTLIFRVPLICGEGQREENALRQFVHQAQNGDPLEVWGDGTTLREWVHPMDVARAYLLGLKHLYFGEMDKPYEIFILGNQPIMMKELARLAVMKVGKGEVKLLPEKPKLFDQYTNYSKAERILGWEPKVKIEEIVERIVKEAKA